MSVPDVPGVYGKLPLLGDFVSRRLPTSFVQTWDAWLQSAISASREQLGTEWIEAYVTSPIWRFILSPGNCGERASAGILMPSVDKVGRYFPLTLATLLGESEACPQLFVTAATWFDSLEHLALSALENDFKLDEFDQRLQERLLPPPLMAPRPANTPGKLDIAFQTEMETLERLPDALIELGGCLLAHLFPAYSLWCTHGSEQMKPALLVYSGMPPAGAFCDFLIGTRQPNTEGGSSYGLPSLTAPIPAHVLRPKPPRETSSDMPIKWHSCGCSTAGKVRELNEDAYLENPDKGVWAVADGMGGHLAGDEASKAVIDALGAIPASDVLETLSASAAECLQRTNTALIKRARQETPDQIMGSTVVVMLAVSRRCASLWAGDSRLYRYRSGLLSQLTRDHSLASEMAPQAHRFPGELPESAQRNIVTRALGAVPELAVDRISFDARPGDIYLLCTDGLIKELHPHEIAEILSQFDCEGSSRSLIDLALARGARDNVTVVVVTAEGHPEPDVNNAKHTL
jgi:type VI secretion system protein ImpM